MTAGPAPVPSTVSPPSPTIVPLSESGWVESFVMAVVVS